MINKIRKREDQLQISLNYNNSEVWISTGIKVDNTHWDTQNKTIYPDFEHLYKERIADFKDKIPMAVKELEEEDLPVTGMWIRKFVLQSGGSEEDTLLKGMDHYLASRVANMSNNTLKKIRQLIDKIKRYDEFYNLKLTPENVTKVEFERFVDFLSKQDHLNDNTISTHVGVLKNLLQFMRPELSFSYVRFSEQYFDLVYLNDEEVNALEKAENLPPYMEKTRDVFLMMCYTGAKYADLPMVIAKAVADIHEGKNTRKVTNPYADQLKLLLIKFSGRVPSISNQKLNDYLKDLFRHLKLDRKIPLHAKRGGIIEEQHFPLYEKISCQWARKTFIASLLSKKVPLEDVMALAGINDLDTLKPYLDMLFPNKHLYFNNPDRISFDQIFPARERDES